MFRVLACVDDSYSQLVAPHQMAKNVFREKKVTSLVIIHYSYYGFIILTVYLATVQVLHCTVLDLPNTNYAHLIKNRSNKIISNL